MRQILGVYIAYCIPTEVGMVIRLPPQLRVCFLFFLSSEAFQQSPFFNIFPILAHHISATTEGVKGLISTSDSKAAISHPRYILSLAHFSGHLI